MAIAQNHLIDLLPHRSRRRLLAVSRSVPLELGTVLCESGKPMRHVYFPSDCSISLTTAAFAGGPGLEVGMVGREGMLGAQLVLGVGAIALHALVRGAGTARRVEAAPFRREMALNVPLRRTLNRYLYVLMEQLVASAGCTRFHTIGPRLARCLLMSHDRAQADDFHLTHESLAAMLGVRRVGITCAAGELQRRGLIHYHRGQVFVLDRAGLEAAACDCYAADLRTYDRVLG